ncbi:MAG: diguanylate cyclase [Alphaproteobacteria bacterium]|nr:diguanylate cyclase [Alphaproteobacteria bacterium]
MFEGSPVRVLLVEDEPADAVLVRALLKETRIGHFDVAVEARLSGAVRHASEVFLDVVLLDLSLPDSLGLDTVRAFRQAAPHLPIVVLTGLEDEEIGLQSIREGCQDYLVKGRGDGDALAKSIMYAIERKRLEVELIRAREEHRLSEERYRLLVDSSPDAILVCTADDVLFVNDAARRLCPDPSVPLRGRELTALIASRDAPRVGALIEEAIRGVRPSVTVEAQVRGGDGRLTDAEIVVLAIGGEGGRAAEVIVRDLTARHEADRYRTMMASVFEGTSEAMIVTDADARVRVVNAAFSEITGYAPEEIIGRTPRILAAGRHPREFYEDMWHTLMESGHWRGDVWNRRKNGDVYVQHLAISAIRGHDGTIENFVGVFNDVTEQRQKEDRIRHRAFHDALTGLPNRALLEDRLNQSVARARRHDGGLAVLFLDLDGFKPINDRYGHHAGDELLRQVAVRLKDCVREVDTVARIGGDEFVVLLTDVTDCAGAGRAARMILDAFRQPFALDATIVSVGCSIGVAVFPLDGDDPASLLDNADAAMYEAKRDGKGAFCFYGGHRGEPAWASRNPSAKKA